MSGLVIVVAVVISVTVFDTVDLEQVDGHTNAFTDEVLVFFQQQSAAE